MINGFVRAKEYNYMRQNYLNYICNDLDDNVIENVIYDDNGKKSERMIEYYYALNLLDKKSALKFRDVVQKSNNINAAILYPVSQLGRGFPQTIIVYPYAFKCSLDEDEFLTTINQHEYIHGKDLKYGIQLNNDFKIDFTNISNINPLLRTILLESRANFVQADKLFEKNKRRLSGVLDNLFKYLAPLENHIIPKNNLEKEIIKHIKQQKDLFIKKIKK